jgi:hypothetical protein
LQKILEAHNDESAVVNKLEGFACRLDHSIEGFLRTKAIPFEKADKCRTYLYIDGGFIKAERPKILAYFTVAISNMKFKPYVSKTMKKRLNGIFRNDEAPCYLIGQLGKNDSYSNEVEGRELIDFAIGIIRIGYNAVGGRFVRVDSRNNDKLMKFYEGNGFRMVQTDDESGLIQFVRFFDG